MPTIVTKTIKPGGGGDYTDIASAITGETSTAANGDLVTRDVILKLVLYANGTTGHVVNGGISVPYSATAAVGSFRTDATHYVWLTAADSDRHAGVYNASAAKLVRGPSFTATSQAWFFLVGCDFVCDGIEIDFGFLAADTASTNLFYPQGGAYAYGKLFVLDGIIVKGSNFAAAGAGAVCTLVEHGYSEQTYFVVRNCVTSGITGGYYQSLQTHPYVGTAFVSNNTFSVVGDSTIGAMYLEANLGGDGGGRNIIVNNICYAESTRVNSLVPGFTGTPPVGWLLQGNYTNRAEGIGNSAVLVESATFAFVNASAGNYALAAGDTSGAKTGGYAATEPGGTWTAFRHDATTSQSNASAVKRPEPWSAGAVQYGGSGTGVVVSAVGAVGATTASTLTVPYPAYVDSGDVLVLDLVASDAVVSTLAGWTLALGTTNTNSTPNLRTETWWKAAAGTEAGTSLAVTRTSGGVAEGRIRAIRGANTTVGIETIAASANASSTTVTYPSLTTTTAGDLVLASPAVANATSTLSAPSGGTGLAWTAPVPHAAFDPRPRVVTTGGSNPSSNASAQGSRGASTTKVQIPVGASAQAGDRLTVAITVKSATITVTSATGFTLAGTVQKDQATATLQTWIYERTLTSTDPFGSYLTITLSAATQWTAVTAIHRNTGARDTLVQGQLAVAATIATWPSVTPASSGALLFLFAGASTRAGRITSTPTQGGGTWTRRTDPGATGLDSTYVAQGWAATYAASNVNASSLVYNNSPSTTAFTPQASLGASSTAALYAASYPSNTTATVGVGHRPFNAGQQAAAGTISGVSGTASAAAVNTGTLYAIPPAATTVSVNTLRDAFGAASIDTGLWDATSGNSGGGTVSEGSGDLIATAVSGTASTAGIQSKATYSFRDGAAYVRVDQALTASNGSSQETNLYALADGTNYIQMWQQGTSLTAAKRVANAFATLASVSYVPSTHLWWRIRYINASSTWEWATSADGTTWSVLATDTTVSFSPDALSVQLSAKNPGALTLSQPTAKFANLNVTSTSATVSGTLPVTSTSVASPKVGATLAGALGLSGTSAGGPRADGTATGVMPLTATATAGLGVPAAGIVDTFTSTSIDSTKWTASGSGMSQPDGMLHALASSGETYYTSAAGYTLRDSAVVVQLVQPLGGPSAPIGNTVLNWLAGGNTLQFLVQQGSPAVLQAFKAVSGVGASIGQIPYSPTTHKWLRLRYADPGSGYAYLFETWDGATYLADGVTPSWVQRFSDPATGLSPDTGAIQLGVNNYTPTATSTPALFDNVNSVPATATGTGTLPITGTSAGSVSVTGTATAVLPLSGTASGRSTDTATATGTLPLTGSLAGRPIGSATSAGTLSIAEVSTANPLGQSTATGNVLITGSSAASLTVNAVTTAVLPLASSSTGNLIGQAQSSGVLPFSETSNAVVSTTGTVFGLVPITGTAAGTSGVTGTATATLPIAAQANAVPVSQAGTSSALNVYGGATGQSSVTGATLTTLVLSATANGSSAINGSTTAVLGFIGTASETESTNSSATGFLSFVSTSSGEPRTTTVLGGSTVLSYTGSAATLISSAVTGVLLLGEASTENSVVSATQAYTLPIVAASTVNPVSDASSTSVFPSMVASATATDNVSTVSVAVLPIVGASTASSSTSASLAGTLSITGSASSGFYVPSPTQASVGSELFFNAGSSATSSIGSTSTGTLLFVGNSVVVGRVTATTPANLTITAGGSGSSVVSASATTASSTVVTSAVGSSAAAAITASLSIIGSLTSLPPLVSGTTSITVPVFGTGAADVQIRGTTLANLVFSTAVQSHVSISTTASTVLLPLFGSAQGFSTDSAQDSNALSFSSRAAVRTRTEGSVFGLLTVDCRATSALEVIVLPPVIHVTLVVAPAIICTLRMPSAMLCEVQKAEDTLHCSFAVAAPLRLTIDAAEDTLRCPLPIPSPLYLGVHVASSVE